MQMPTVSLNYLAIIVTALVPMILGTLWYGPLFGQMWMREMGISRADMEKAKKSGSANKAYMWATLGSLVMSYVLAHFVDYVGAVTWQQGASLGFWIWLGFVVTKGLSDTVFNGSKWSLYYLSMGYYLVTLPVMGAILAVWV